MHVLKDIITIDKGKKIYFASDFHFGIPDYAQSRLREERVCDWLNLIAKDAQQIYLLGDLFDSWMEYKKVVPKGSIRFLGKLAELSDRGIDIIIFTGNHDLWMHGYFEQELHAVVCKQVETISINGKIFHIGHGDGLLPAERPYRYLKQLLHHPISQAIYRQLHPDLGLRLADYFSRLGPKHKYEDLQMQNPEKEYQIQYAKLVLQKQAVDTFIFGHRHIACCIELNNSSTFINLGDWISHNTYAVFDGEKTTLLKY